MPDRRPLRRPHPCKMRLKRHAETVNMFQLYMASAIASQLIIDIEAIKYREEPGEYESIFGGNLGNRSG